MKKTTTLLGVFLISLFFARAQPWQEHTSLPHDGAVTSGFRYGSSSEVFIGGEFTHVGLHSFEHVYIYDVNTKAVRSAGSLPSAPRTFFYDRFGRINVGGNFPVSGKWYGAMTYDPLPPPLANNWQPNPEYEFTGIDPSLQWISSAVVWGITEVVCGNISEINNVPLHGIGWNQGGFWTPLLTSVNCSWLPGGKGKIYTVAIGDDDFLKILGEFDNLSYDSGPSSWSINAVNFASYDGVHVTAHNIASGSSATAYLFYGGKDHITGTFISPVSGLLKWDGGNMVPAAGGYPIFGKALAIACNGRAFLGGKQFHTSGAEGNLASTDGSTWQDESNGLFATGNEVVTQLIAVGSKMIAIGTFKKYKGNAADYVAIKEICPQASLPVTLHSFTARVQGRNVLLEWKAEMTEEQNRFVVERALDGQHFESIATVEGNRDTRTYQYFDQYLLTGVVYYRLRYDIGVNQKYSKVLPVSIAQGSTPSVIAGAGTLSIINAGGNVQIVNMAGQIFFRKRISGSETISLPRGIYIVSFEQRYTRKIVVN